MTEQCPFCGAKFYITEIGGDGICGACQEPINCPYCFKTLRKERTTGVFKVNLMKSPESQLSQYLEISDIEWAEMEASLNPSYGHNDDIIYSYWFVIPDNTSEKILKKTGWKVNQIISDIPISVVDYEQYDNK